MKKNSRPEANGPRSGTSETAASYSRFSSELQDTTSIDQQQQRCREVAERNGHLIDPNLEFADEAISGTKLDRPGLNALLKAAADGLFTVLYLYSQSRLARESTIAMNTLKMLVEVYGIRVICASGGLDTIHENWVWMAQFSSMKDEGFIQDLAHNVRRGQEHNVRLDRSVGDHCFGYLSVLEPGFKIPEIPRRGLKIPKVYAIDEDAKKWVKRIFEWFVVERRSIRWIVGELNRLKVPKDHRATTPNWRHASVFRVLQNEKYIGIWPWGRNRNKRNPFTGKVWQQRVPEEDSDRNKRNRPDLAIVEKPVFLEAQRLLAENKQKHCGRYRENGKYKGSQVGQHAPKRLLSGLLQCGECQRFLHLGRSGGRYFFCPGYDEGTCKCQTTVPRELAERLIVRAIQDRLTANPTWSEAVWQTTRQAWLELKQNLPDETKAIEKSLSEVKRKIDRLVDQIESGGKVDEVQERLAQRRRERDQLQRQLDSLQARQPKLQAEPTRSWVEQQLQSLANLLASSQPAAAYALRDLVGGKIIVEQVIVPGRKRHYLRAKMQLRLSSIVPKLDSAFITDSPEGEKIELDLREVVVDDRIERAKAMYDRGMLGKEIAKELGCRPAKVTQLLHKWSELHGVPLPDGRKRVHGVKYNRGQRPMHQRIAQRVMELEATGLLLDEIAQQLDCDRNMVTQAYQWWHQQRGLPIPDGRTRRKQLPPKTSQDRDAGSAPAA